MITFLGSDSCASHRPNLDMSDTSLNDDEDSPQTFLSSSTTTVSYYGEEVNRGSSYVVSLTNNNFPSNVTSQSDNFQKSLNLKKEMNSMPNFFGNNDNYSVRRSYVEEEKVARITSEKNDIKSTTAFSVPFNNFVGPVEVKVNSKDAEDSIVRSINDEKIRKPLFLSFKRFPQSARKSIFNDKVKKPYLFRPFVYFTINPYYYYRSYRVRPDRRNIFFPWNKRDRNYYIMIPKKSRKL